MKYRYLILNLLVGIVILPACDDYLDPKPNQSLVVPTTLEDVRLLLDNTTVFVKQPVLNIHAGDEFFITDEGLHTLGLPEQGAYLWMEDLFQGDPGYDWSTPYQQVFYSNVALEALDGFNQKDDLEYRILRGEALFRRAQAYYHLLQVFAPPYQMNGGNDLLPGIVLKSGPDVNEKAVRANLQDSYIQVLNDFREAEDLLPGLQLPKTRPSKAAALGMLARLNLVMFDYDGAAEAALEALSIYSDKLDFNDIDVESSRPFVRFGEETVFYSELISVTLTHSTEVFVDTLLIDSYKEGDLRLPAYFDQVDDNRYLARGRLTGNAIAFGGLSSGELELMAAEALARTGDEQEARNYLNSLLSRRMTPDSFTPVDATGEELLAEIFSERKKELVGRGIRWTDLRRLNQYPAFAKSIERLVEGQLIILEPNSSSYVFPIPDEEIMLSGIKQNER